MWTSHDAIWRLVTVDVTMPTEREALEMTISARMVYKSTDINQLLNSIQQVQTLTVYLLIT